MTYTFSFDARFCSGCKACQAACKDKNNLPTGVLWRRVIEVSGGGWQFRGDAWENTVFAYNLSLACNHCIHPKCAGICPTNAYTIRPDGIVLLDESKCIGCGYCAWACPYGAPQYNPAAGHMGKCNLCFDQIDQGLPPACVAACPLRVLDYKEVDSRPAKDRHEVRLWEMSANVHPFPLPVRSHTQPRLAIKPHAAMGATEEKLVANREEIQPRLASAWEDVPLILFTLLAQMAAGSFWAMLWMFPGLWMATGREATPLHLFPLLAIGACLGIGLLASLAHLGTKRKALLALQNLRRSWLSREVLFAGLFGAGWLMTTAQSLIGGQGTLELAGLTATLGLGLVYSMSRVYRLPAVPAWNTWRTNAGFLVSALLLGQSAMTALLAYTSHIIGMPGSPLPWLMAARVTLILLIAQRIFMHQPVFQGKLHLMRTGLILVGILITLTGFFVSTSPNLWISLSVYLIIVMEETLGRWSFYRSRPRAWWTSALDDPHGDKPGISVIPVGDRI
jgi:anaerobic dimethyl sulfoxide reductase subunit B